MRTQSILLGSASVLLALSWGASADAATKKHHKAAAPAVSSTQKEIDDLEAKVQFLTDRLDEQAAVSRDALTQLQAAKAQAAQAQAQAAQAQATVAADDQKIETIPTQVQTAVIAIKPKTDKLYYKGISITMGGFAAAESVYRSRDETADIGSSYAKIPYASDPASHTGETRLTGRQSRYSILAQGDVNATTQAAFYGEFDFLGAAQTANSNESNSYQPRIRHLYGTLDWNDTGWHLLAGQNWSLVTMNSKGITPRNEVTPPTIDAQYVVGFAWARQPQVRITKDFDDKQLWVAVSAEQAQTAGITGSYASGLTSSVNAQAPTSQFYNGTNYSTNQYPDVVGKVAFEPKIQDHTLHLEVFGVGRAFTDRLIVTPTTGTVAAALGLSAGKYTVTEWGGGFGGGATFDLVPHFLDVQISGMAGNGIGRYGTGQLSDVVIRPDGHLIGLEETMYMGGLTLHPVPQLDIYVFGGQEQEGSKTFKVGTAVSGFGTLPGSSNAGCIVEGGSCSAVTKSLSQVAVGLWDRFYQGPFGRLQVGLQYSYTEKQAFADATGLAPKADENMIFTSFRYYPF